jgi:hypothetical protein
VIEGWATRHESSAGKNSLSMRSDNSFIYSAGEAEVVGVEDQSFHLRTRYLRGDEMISRGYGCEDFAARRARYEETFCESNS